MFISRLSCLTNPPTGLVFGPTAPRAETVHLKVEAQIKDEREGRARFRPCPTLVFFTQPLKTLD